MSNLARMQDDNESETSIESNTSDSGRGGSESDIHSTLGHTNISHDLGTYIYTCMHTLWRTEQKQIA